MDRNGLDFDLIVVGGGPGGAAVATFVAMHGHRVLLLERERFPRYSIGESLLPGTVHGVCRLLGVREEIEQANFVRKYGGTWRWGREAALWSFFFSENEELHKQKFDYAFQVERARFDEILLRNAQRKGADVRENHEVRDLLQEGGRTSGVRFVDAAGATHEARARFVVDASGHRSHMARVAGERINSKFFRNVALFGYFHGAKRRPAPRQGDILCAAFDVGWFWFIPLSDTLTSVGAVIDARRAELIQGDRERALASLIGRCPVVAELLSEATRVTEGMYGTLRVRGDYSYCNTHFFSPGLVLVGDSACFVDPVFSTGVHLATYAALLAARSINACLEADIDEARAFEEFQHRYLLEFQNIYDFLLVIYDMNQDSKSYFWEARRILNTDEADNEAFVRLVAGFGTSGQDFFARRAGLGTQVEARMPRHFYSPRANVARPARAGGGNYGDYLEEQMRRNAFAAEKLSLTTGVPFAHAPVRAGGLIASTDGLSWVEPVFSGANG